MLELLEGIDDDLDRLGVGMVKISEASAAKYENDYLVFDESIKDMLDDGMHSRVFSIHPVFRDWGINRGLGIVYFESGVPFIYQVSVSDDS